MGHNSADEQERHRKQQFFKLLAQHNGYLSDRAGADSEIKSVYQRGQTFSLTKKHFDYAKKFQDAEKEAAFMDDLQVMMEVAEWMGAKPSRQLSLNLNDRTPRADIAQAAGFRIGAMGGSAKNPHDMGSDEGQAWQRGFNEGNEFRNASFRDAVEGTEPPDDEPAEAESPDGEAPEEKTAANDEAKPAKAKRSTKKKGDEPAKTQDDVDWDSAAPAPTTIN